MKLTLKQEEILQGLLLGDGCLFLGKSNISPLLSIARASKDLQYLKYHLDIFQNICSDEGIIQSDKNDIKRGKTYKGFRFRTRSIPVLSPYYEQWYREQKKIVPVNLRLTPFIVATWFADDGCILRKKSRNGASSSALILKISTNSFTKNEVDFLASQLSSILQEKISVNKDSLDWYKKKNPDYIPSSDNYYIKMYTEAAWKFYNYIKDHLPDGMDRKFSVWKDLENGRLATTSSSY